MTHCLTPFCLLQYVTDIHLKNVLNFNTSTCILLCFYNDAVIHVLWHNNNTTLTFRITDIISIKSEWMNKVFCTKFYRKCNDNYQTTMHYFFFIYNHSITSSSIFKFKSLILKVFNVYYFVLGFLTKPLRVKKNRHEKFLKKSNDRGRF